jgi:hypothetical protein
LDLRITTQRENRKRLGLTAVKPRQDAAVTKGENLVF